LYERLIRDRAGNIYGATAYGGSQDFGTVFKLTPDGTLTVLHAFAGGDDGRRPYSGLIRNKVGNLYGTTLEGGTDDYGTVFKLAPDGTETILHTFTGDDGANPYAALIKDRDGNLYGTATHGGSQDVGTVFKIAPNGGFTKLYDFSNSEGEFPYGRLLRDQAGNLYGTAAGGGAYDKGDVFMLDRTLTVLYSFGAGSDGYWPQAGMINDKAGNLYGTTSAGGAGDYGTVFKLATDGTETVLHSFNLQDGSSPVSDLIMDRAGTLYGTSYYGGHRNINGTVFSLTRKGSFKVLHYFSCKTDGCNGPGNLSKDNSGNLYGTTRTGGAHGYGTVFEIVK
jgi:uncharacterized repeat protein (TIGR03803 family)